MTKSLGYIFLLSSLGLGLTAQDKEPAAKAVLAAKNGNVTFDHAAHAKREKDKCSACHPAPFAQESKLSDPFKFPHKALEEKKASCGSCHRAEGKAFAAAGNCAKCHVRGEAKKG